MTSPNPSAGAPDPSKVANRFERLAQMYMQTLMSTAQGLARATAEPPPASVPMEGRQLVDAWNHSPSPNPAADFWQVHDAALAQALQQAPSQDPQAVAGAHHQAELAALQAVYPYRAELAGVGANVLADQVAKANKISRQAQDAAPTPAPPPPPAATALPSWLQGPSAAPTAPAPTADDVPPITMAAPGANGGMPA